MPPGRGGLLAFAAAALLAVAAPTNAYRFFGATGLVLTSSPAVRWAPDDRPIHFRLLKNAHLPEERLGAAEWRALVTRALAQWTNIPTSTIVVVLDEEPLAADFADADDGRNTIGFTGDEFWEDSRSFARAVTRQEAARTAGCDIIVSPKIFEHLDRRARDNPQREMERLGWLEVVVAHEIGHCLGLAHTDLNSAWEARPGMPAAHREGFYPEGVAALRANPVMSYGGLHDFVGLTPDDATGLSLLYPTAEFLESTGAVGGRVVLADSRGASFMYVQAVFGDGSAAGPHLGPGAFTDAYGQFLIEGLPPGRHLFWAHPVGDLLPLYRRAQWEVPELLKALALRDRWFWAEVRAGELDLLPPVTMVTGRESP